MSDWKPIETAPKDGTPILIYYESPATSKLQWSLDRRSHRFIRIARWNGRVWKLDQSGHFRNDVFRWQPLPVPPTPTET